MTAARQTIVVNYPVSTNLLNEAKLYAQESIRHTMNYQGWEDQKAKFSRITTGKFGQLWVAEFCRLNGIEHQKDVSSPTVPDDFDLIVKGQKIDVKTSTIHALVGQVSPGVIDKPCDFYCFMLTDKLCSFVAPYGLIAHHEYRAVSVKVEQGERIPGTTITQRFSASYFLPEEKQLIPFVHFMLHGATDRRAVVNPCLVVDQADVQGFDERLSSVERLMIQIVSAMSSSRPEKRTGNVVSLRTPQNDLFGSRDE